MRLFMAAMSSEVGSARRAAGASAKSSAVREPAEPKGRIAPAVLAADAASAAGTTDAAGATAGRAPIDDSGATPDPDGIGTGSACPESTCAVATTSLRTPLPSGLSAATMFMMAATSTLLESAIRQLSHQNRLGTPSYPTTRTAHAITMHRAASRNRSIPRDRSGHRAALPGTPKRHAPRIEPLHPCVHTPIHAPHVETHRLNNLRSAMLSRENNLNERPARNASRPVHLPWQHLPIDHGTVRL